MTIQRSRCGFRPSSIDKAGQPELITISGPANAPVATPSVVTWTLTYTLTDGPVTNAVITDEIPVGFVFLDAANGGTETDGVVTWTFADADHERQRHLPHHGRPGDDLADGADREHGDHRLRPDAGG